MNRVAGTSAGSLIAAYYLLDLPLSTCLKKAITMTEEIRKRPLGVFDRNHQIVDLLPAALDETFPDDAHKIVGNKLYVCMTRLKDMKKVVVNQFDSKKDLIDALNCSCYIPLWSGTRVPTYKGVKHIDGGFTDCLPAFDERTIRICCFSGDTDISPFDRIKPKLLSRSVVNMPLYLNCSNLRRGKKALTPLPAAQIMHLLECGFQDTKSFILTNDLIQCDRCFNETDPRDQPVYSKLSPCITPALSPINHRRMLPKKRESKKSLSPSSKRNTNNFNRLLREKLGSPGAHRLEDGDNGVRNMDAPRITIDPAESLSEERRLSLRTSVNLGASNGATKIKSREITRRNSCPKQSTTIVDRFKGSLEPLPSCPPSPNLNRHCPDCIRMRHDARVDLLEESVRAEAEKYVVWEKPSKNKLANPLRWFKQLRTKNSYNLEPSADMAAV